MADDRGSALSVSSTMSSSAAATLGPLMTQNRKNARGKAKPAAKPAGSGTDAAGEGGASSSSAGAGGAAAGSSSTEAPRVKKAEGDRGSALSVSSTMTSSAAGALGPLVGRAPNSGARPASKAQARDAVAPKPSSEAEAAAAAAGAAAGERAAAALRSSGGSSSSAKPNGDQRSGISTSANESSTQASALGGLVASSGPKGSMSKKLGTQKDVEATPNDEDEDDSPDRQSRAPLLKTKGQDDAGSKFEEKSGGYGGSGGGWDNGGYTKLPTGPEEAATAAKNSEEFDDALKPPLPAPLLAGVLVLVCTMGLILVMRQVHVSAMGTDVESGRPRLGQRTAGCSDTSALWTEWSQCARCGGGQQARQKKFQSPAAHASSQCRQRSAIEESRSCAAPAFALASDWAAWGACSASCGVGRQSRTRVAPGGTQDCEDVPTLTEVRLCESGMCTSSAGGSQYPILTTVAPQRSRKKKGVAVSLKVQHVDYARLSKDPSMLHSFKAAIRAAMASEAGPGTNPDSIQVSIAAGSVAVKAIVVPANGDDAAVGSLSTKLNSSPSLGQSVMSSVSKVGGIDSVATGTISVSDVATTETETDAPEDTTSQVPPQSVAETTTSPVATTMAPTTIATTQASTPAPALPLTTVPTPPTSSTPAPKLAPTSLAPTTLAPTATVPPIQPSTSASVPPQALPTTPPPVVPPPASTQQKVPPAIPTIVPEQPSTTAVVPGAMPVGGAVQFPTTTTYTTTTATSTTSTTPKCPDASGSDEIAWSDWSDWGTCSKQCDRGMRSRSRHIRDTYKACPTLTNRPLIDQEACGPSPSEMLTSWSQWGACSSPCGDGQQARRREVKPLYGSCAIPVKSLQEEKPCFVKCTGVCVLGDWSSWTDCAAVCSSSAAAAIGAGGSSLPQLAPGAGLRERRRVTLVDGMDCGPTVQRLPCTPATPCRVPSCSTSSSAEPSTPVSTPPGGDAVGGVGWPGSAEDAARAPPVKLQSCSGTLPGTACEAACKAGFAPSGPVPCLNGDLQSRAVTCQEEPCMEPPSIENSSDLRACAGAAHSATCNVTCVPGYVKTEDPVCVRGKWSRAQCRPALCPDLPAIPKAKASTKGCASWARTAAPGEPCPVFACEEGFEPAGSLRCIAGNWAWPRCTAANASGGAATGAVTLASARRLSTSAYCEGIPVIDHSTDLAICAGAPDGAVCNVLCLPGFAPISNAVCKLGQWSGGGCREIRCARPPEVAHGRVDGPLCMDLKLGETCAVQCDSGYTLEGELRCLGPTMGGGARCVPAACKQPPEIPNADALAACAGAPHGALCSVSCLPGFEKSADILCLRGAWSQGVCKAQTCNEIPTVLHAKGLEGCAGTPDGVVCDSFDCEDGFERSVSLTCSKGQFSAVSCRPATCAGPLPTVGNAKPLNDCTQHHDFKVCAVECNADFVKTSDAFCVNGKWLLPECKVSDKSQDDMGSMIEIVIDEGALGSTSDFLTLSASLASGMAAVVGVAPPRIRVASLRRVSSGPQGSRVRAELELWPPSAAKTIPPTPVPPQMYALQAAQRLVARAAEQYSDLHQEGTLVPGALLVGLQVLGFTAGEPCRVPPRSPEALALSLCAPALPGAICAPRCPEGQKPMPEAAVCFNGHWAPQALKCEDLPCKSPPSMPGGANLTGCSGYQSGSRCAVTCAPGFRKVGDLECNRGNWSLLGGTSISAASACEPAPCEVAPTILHSAPLTACAGMASGRTCQPQCEEGYVPSSSDDGKGKAGIQCLNGNWQYPKAVSCEPLGCISTPVVPHAGGSLERCRGLQSGQPCIFKCQPGYEPVGQLTCLSGQWTSASCAPMKCLSIPKLAGHMTLQYQHCIGTASGERCKITCQEWRHTKTDDLLCFAGSWQNEQSVGCFPDSDPPPQPCAAAPTILHGYGPSCQGTPSGSGCGGNPCVPDYHIHGYLHCAAGVWTSATCEPDPCQLAPKAKHSASLLLCGGLAKSAFCPLLCKPGFSAGGAAASGRNELVSLQTLDKVALSCSEGHSFMGPSCEPSPCDSYPALPDVGDLSDCMGAGHGKTCELRCRFGFSINATSAVSSNIRCSHGAWQRPDSSVSCSAAACTEAPPGAEEAKWKDGAKQCMGTASRDFCTPTCPFGSLPSAALVCLQGRWLEAGASCKRYCAAPPPEITGATNKLSQCVPTEVGGFCPVTCQEGYLPTGDLMCDPERQTWSTVSCEPKAQEYPLSVTQSLDMRGLQIGASDAERVAIAKTLAGAVAQHVGLGHHLVSVHIKPAAEPPRPGGENPVAALSAALFGSPPDPSPLFNAELSVFCAAAPQCATVARRLDLAAKALPQYAAAFARGICEARCLPPGSSELKAGEIVGRGPSAAPGSQSTSAADAASAAVSAAAASACLGRCPEGGGRLALLYASDARQVRASKASKAPSATV